MPASSCRAPHAVGHKQHDQDGELAEHDHIAASHHAAATDFACSFKYWKTRARKPEAEVVEMAVPPIASVVDVVLVDILLVKQWQLQRYSRKLVEHCPGKGPNVFFESHTPPEWVQLPSYQMYANQTTLRTFIEQYTGDEAKAFADSYHDSNPSVQRLKDDF